MKFGTNEILFLYCEIMGISKPSEINYNKALLDSSANSIYATFDKTELYPTNISKAAQLCYSLIKNHAFKDGNKRIGIASMLAFLTLKNIKLLFTQEELIDLGLGVASGNLLFQDIFNWPEKHKI